MTSAILSNTTAFRLMNAIEASFPEEIRVLKGAALLFERLHVNVGGPGPISDVRRSISDKHSTLRQFSEQLIRPVDELKPVAGGSYSSILASLDSDLVNEDELARRMQELNSGAYRMNQFQDPSDPLLGPINPLAALLLTLKYRTPYYEAAERMDAHTRLVKERNGYTEETALTTVTPDYSALSWKDIADIRDDPKWLNFIGKVNGVRDPRELEDEINKAAYEIFRGVRQTESPVWRQLLSFIPTGTVPNPLGILDAVQDLNRKKQRHRKFGWLYIVDRIRDRADHS